MRDFKYRVFIDGKMHLPCVSEEYANITWHGINVVTEDEGEKKRAHVMFSSGLQDKNGIDIYEGDITKMINAYYDGDILEKGFRGEVMFEDGSFCVKGDGVSEFLPLDEVTIDAYEIEVTGNVHENP